jgi:transcription elongation factor GreA
MKRTPLTVQGAAKLNSELEALMALRPKIVEAIAEARAHGDLKENAEYHAAREQQGMNEARIAHIESALASADIIDPKAQNPGGRVVFGAIIEICDQDTDETENYQIVGDLEADFTEKKISISSPIARALIGKEEGDVVDIQAPGGKRSVEILSVRYE